MNTLPARRSPAAELAGWVTEDDARILELDPRQAPVDRQGVPAGRPGTAGRGRVKGPGSVSLRESPGPQMTPWPAMGWPGDPSKAAWPPIKSLFSFALKTGYLKLDPARALAPPKVPDLFAQAHLGRRNCGKDCCGEPDPGRRLLLLLFYASGGRRFRGRQGPMGGLPPSPTPGS